MVKLPRGMATRLEETKSAMELLMAVSTGNLPATDTTLTNAGDLWRPMSIMQTPTRRSAFWKHSVVPSRKVQCPVRLKDTSSNGEMHSCLKKSTLPNGSTGAPTRAPKARNSRMTQWIKCVSQSVPFWMNGMLLVKSRPHCPLCARRVVGGQQSMQLESCQLKTRVYG